MIVISRRLARPVELLAERERQIASGNWHQRLDLSGSRELKALAVNFNRMAETVEQKVAELETGNQEKEIFIHNLSHEMKTPLMLILGYAQLLRRTAMKPEDAEKALDVIESEARRMEQLSSRLMQLIMAAQPLKISPETEQQIQSQAKAWFEINRPEFDMASLTGIYAVQMKNQIALSIFADAQGHKGYLYTNLADGRPMAFGTGSFAENLLVSIENADFQAPNE